MKTAFEILLSHYENHLFDSNGNPAHVRWEILPAMEEYKKQSVSELIERLADARYIIKIMYDKIPLEQTTQQMSTIISEISILLDKYEQE